MTVQNLQNYKMLADMIPELDDLVQTGILAPTTSIDDDLQDENSKLRALISNNFGRRKNDPAKDRKADQKKVPIWHVFLLMKSPRGSICLSVIFKEPYE